MKDTVWCNSFESCWHRTPPSRNLSWHRASRTSTMSVTRPSEPAVLYARVSSKDQEREGFSIPAQQKLLRQYAHEQRLTVLREFVDVETAKQAGRGGFAEM